MDANDTQSVGDKDIEQQTAPGIESVAGAQPEARSPQAENSDTAKETAADDGESFGRQGIKFRSDDIKEVDGSKYFVNIEGAEERKKETVRRLKQQQDELAKERKAKELATKKAASAKQRQAASANRKSFIAKHKLAIIAFAILAIIAIVALVVYFTVVLPPLQKEKENSEASIRIAENTKKFSSQLQEQFDAGEKTPDEIEAWALEEIEKEKDDHVKFDYYSALVTHLLDYDNYERDALGYIEKMEDIATSDIEMQHVYGHYNVYYTHIGDYSKAFMYYEKLNEFLEEEGKVGE